MEGVTVEEFEEIVRESLPFAAALAPEIIAMGDGRAKVRMPFKADFLRKPAQAAIVAEARMLKVGRRLAVGEVELYTEGDDEMVAHVVATYSIPPS